MVPDASTLTAPSRELVPRSSNALTRKSSVVLAGWFLAVMVLSATFRSWWVLEIYVFPSLAFVWMLRNEDRLRKTRPDLRQLSPSAKIHFFFSIPLLIAVKLVLSIAQSAREADAWRLMLAMSFGLAWVIVILYAFALVSRKRRTADGK